MTIGRLAHVKLYHSTTPRAARKILRAGLCDTGKELHEGRWYGGVWLSDRSLPELGSEILVIEVPDEFAQQYELPGALHGYRRWLIPASILASHGPIRRLDAKGLGQGRPRLGQ